MSFEFDVKEIFNRDGTPESKAEAISKFANFKKENVIKSLTRGTINPSENYSHLIFLEKLERGKNESRVE